MLNRSDYECQQAYARDMRAGGYDCQDRWGRQLYSPGSDNYGRAQAASVLPRARKPAPQSEFLSTSEFWKRYASVAAANFEGHILSWMMTVSWGSLGLSGEAAGAAQHRFLNLMGKWRSERGLPLTWIWVREHGSKLGDHTHILLSLEWWHEADFLCWARGAVETVTGQPALRKAKGQPLQTVHLSNSYVTRPGDVRAQWELFQYVCKGIDPEAMTPIFDRPTGKLMASRLVRNCRAPGVVIGQRSGSSRALGPQRVGELRSSPFWPRRITSLGVPLYDDTYLAAGRAAKSQI